MFGHMDTENIKYFYLNNYAINSLFNLNIDVNVLLDVTYSYNPCATEFEFVSGNKFEF